MRRIPEAVGERVASVVGAAVWLWPLLSPLAAVVSGDVHPMAPAIAGLAAFMVLYITIVIQAFGHDRRPSTRIRYAELAGLGVLGVGLAAAYAGGPSGWLSVLLYVGAAGVATFATGPFATGWALASVGAVVAIGIGHHLDGSEIGANAFNVLMSCGLVFAIRRMAGYIRELRATQAQLARAAVEQERLRFSRDLHDLLGHTLSLVVVKAEVVRRLVPRDPQAAIGQAADIETIGRNALAEVRQAVTGYRARTLAAELDGARTALADAGIALTVREEGGPLAPEADALFGWTVREGVTNVIRHSQARRCEIAVRRTGDEATLEIRDDGIGPGGPAAGTGAGNGLRGLCERLAAAGGELRAGAGGAQPEPGCGGGEHPPRTTGGTGGFLLTAVLPAGVRHPAPVG